MKITKVIILIIAGELPKSCWIVKTKNNNIMNNYQMITEVINKYKKILFLTLIIINIITTKPYDKN